MKPYVLKTKYACGVDLHSRQMYICIMDRDGNVFKHTNIKGNNLDFFLKLIEPYKSDLTVAVESTFNWYFLKDFCDLHNIEFVIGHALYMKHIHGGKAKNDRIDSRKIADLLRGNYLPPSYCYPAHLRSARDLMRRRGHLVRQRASLLAHISIVGHQFNMDIKDTHKRKEVRKELLKMFKFDKNTYSNIKADLEAIEAFDKIIKRLDLDIRQHALKEARHSFQILKTIQGSGDTISLSILYEIDDINRFKTVKDFTSYARLVKCKAESAGKSYGYSGAKIGNPHLKWAFSELAVYSVIHCPEIKLFFQKHLLNKYSKGKAYSVLAHKLGRAVYFMLKKGTVFDPLKFCMEMAREYRRNPV